MRKDATAPSDAAPPPKAPTADPTATAETTRVPEIGGFKGPEPTRYGDWEHNGRCSDF